MRRIVTVCLIVLSACTRNAAPADPGDNAGSKSGDVASGTQESDWKAIEAMESDAKSLAHAAGCNVSETCRAAPVGSRACGGPRYYIAYCSVTTDSAALFKKLSEISKAEQDYNRKYGIASTCEFRMPPAVESTGGSCVAK